MSVSLLAPAGRLFTGGDSRERETRGRKQGRGRVTVRLRRRLEKRYLQASVTACHIERSLQRSHPYGRMEPPRAYGRTERRVPCIARAGSGHRSGDSPDPRPGGLLEFSRRRQTAHPHRSCAPPPIAPSSSLRHRGADNARRGGDAARNRRARLAYDQLNGARFPRSPPAIGSRLLVKKAPRRKGSTGAKNTSIEMADQNRSR